MAGRSASRAPPAMVEDVDEDGNVIDGSYQYARSNVASPVKTQMNTGRKKSSSRRTTSVSPPYSESDSTELPSTSRSKTKEKRSSMKSSKGKDPVVDKRPVVRSSKTTPARTREPDEASYYGVPHKTIATSRPRAQTARPHSYYGQPRPPVAPSAFYHPGPPGLNPTSYPPPQWGGPSPLGSSPLSTSPLGHPSDYFSKPPDSLAQRFRPRSAMGFHQGSYGPEEYEAPPQDNHLVRRPSLTTRSTKEQEDRRRMPPPSLARPQTAGPARQLFKPPPPSQPRKAVLFNEHDLEDESDHDGGHRRTSIDFTKLSLRPRRQSMSPEYYEEAYTSLQPASSKTKRESRRSASYAFEDKAKLAAQYQDQVSGASRSNLTAENLRQVKNGGSSHSTRSSASRDASSYRQSATTRTTRSGSGDDDITIKVPDGAVVEVGNATVKCFNGGEINIGRSGGGSDRGTVYDDDLKSRATRTDRPSNRHRASSLRRALPAPPRYAPPHSYYPDPTPYRSVYPQYPGTGAYGDYI
ncbi:uncharacterized protein JN550_008703 [Neoarthrinium moseri]|uniref:uncharacterized protein n=1 Tax=Neoarthrinium moseri TaxID=1658444 RepID=UPI001FDAFA24|nr:uncharacterized protein JN550_008703 [Neoarthrinium moseri]KAI1864883.1 hypothetical protein JN550_008703 [Neoarthrinium moseri]